MARRRLIEGRAELLILRQQVLAVKLEAVERNHHPVWLGVQGDHAHPLVRAFPRQVKIALFWFVFRFVFGRSRAYGVCLGAKGGYVV